MTTEATSGARGTGLSVVARTALVAATFSLAVALLAAALGGRTASLAAGISSVSVVVLLLGSVKVVDVAAGLVPAASLVVALLVFGLQVAMALVLLAALSNQGVLQESATSRWLIGGAIAGAAAWIVAHLVFSVRARIPAYDLVQTIDSKSGSKPTTRVGGPA